MLSKSRSCLGFTLIELLLGVVIFSVIAVTIYSVFLSALKIQKRSFGHQEAVVQINLALETMARDLENAADYDFSQSYPSLKSFQASSDQVRFLQATDQGLQFVSYHLEVSDQATRHTVKVGAHVDKNTSITEETSVTEPVYQLVRQTQPWVDGVNESKENLQHRVVARGIPADGLVLGFGSQNPDSGERSWSSSWVSDQAPQLIRVDLTAKALSGQTITLQKFILNPSGSSRSE